MTVTSTGLPAELQERPAAAFSSILFEDIEDRNGPAAAPAFFRDLHLDQIVDMLTAGRDTYNLKPLFYGALRRAQAVRYRQDVMRDLETPDVLAPVKNFAMGLQTMSAHLAQAGKLNNKYQKQAWFLQAAETYCTTTVAFSQSLAGLTLQSRGLRAWRDYLADYTACAAFRALRDDTQALKNDLAAIRYALFIKGGSITVRQYAGEPDYSDEIETTFAKFRHGPAKDYRSRTTQSPYLSYVEERILGYVAQLFPGIFARLEKYCEKYREYPDDRVAAFDREIQFYVAYLEYLERFRRAGLSFCYPEVSASRKDVYSRDGFDLALADRLIREQKVVTCNDFELRGPERVLVVSGPNQGGKTTFARAFGQLHFLASLGCPVPGTAARLFLCDRIHTHFEREEHIETLRGKLQDDLERIHAILREAGADSLIILNEIFTSTTLQDAVFLSTRIMEKITALDALCVWVTFIVEIAACGPQTVSMVAGVQPDNPAERTFKITRQAANGLAYAMAIAEKYRLTYAQIKERLTP